MRLRWLIRKYPQPSREAILAEWDNGSDGRTIGEVIDEMCPKDERVLQVQHHYINQDNGEVVDIWVDIPVFVEEVDFE